MNPMPIVVESAPAEFVPAACQLLLASSKPLTSSSGSSGTLRPYAQLAAQQAAQRLQAMFASCELDPGGLLIARDASTIHGVIFAYRIGGAQSALWLPVAEDDQIQDALVAGALAWIRREPTKIVQALISVSDEANRANSTNRAKIASLRRAGFRSITRLAFLSRVCRPSDATFTPSRLEFRKIEQLTESTIELMLQTYEGSRDVPELNGIRTAAEILAGYRMAFGDSPPAVWELVHAGQRIGVLMLTPHSDAPTIELTYVGLVPSARQKGLGREAIAFAMAQASSSARQSIELNVDVRNEPALGIYRDWMFRMSDLRELLLWLPE